MRLLSEAIVLCILSWIFAAASADVNITIDDQLGDATNGNTVTYKPDGAWSAGLTCDCNADPDLSQVSSGTWTWTKYQPDADQDDPYYGQIRSASVPFFGSAVYVQVVLFNSRASPRGNSDYSFYVDEHEQALFQRMSTNDSSYDYNVTVFAMESLPNQQHTLRIEVGHLNETAIALIDSIIYTQSNGTSPGEDTNASDGSSGSSVNAGAIAGEVVGGLAILSGAIAFLIIRRRRRLRNFITINRRWQDTNLLGSPTPGSRTSNLNSRYANIANPVPYVIGDQYLPSSASSDRSALSLSGLQNAYGYSGIMRKTPLSMDQVQLNTVPMSTLSAIPPTSSIVAHAATALSPPTPAAPTADIYSPLPSYSEANLGTALPQPPESTCEANNDSKRSGQRSRSHGISYFISQSQDRY